MPPEKLIFFNAMFLFNYFKESTQRGGNGKYVRIKHNNTYETQYLHMRRRNVKKGQFVKQGDIIGWVGRTGSTEGRHVC